MLCLRCQLPTKAGSGICARVECKKSKISVEEIEEALRNGAASARELDKKLRRVFRLGSTQRNLILD